MVRESAPDFFCCKFFVVVIIIDLSRTLAGVQLPQPATLMDYSFGDMNGGTIFS